MVEKVLLCGLKQTCDGSSADFLLVLIQPGLSLVFLKWSLMLSRTSTGVWMGSEVRLSWI